MLSIYLELSIEAWLDTQLLVGAKILDRLDIVYFRSYPNKRHWMSVYPTINMLTLIIWIRWWLLDLPNELRFVFPLAMRREPLVWYFDTMHTPIIFYLIVQADIDDPCWDQLYAGLQNVNFLKTFFLLHLLAGILWLRRISLFHTHTSSPAP